jgi:hypothetical protein
MYIDSYKLLPRRKSPLHLQVIWRTNRSSGENYYVFSGGLPVDVTGVTPSITVMQGKSTTLLEMEYSVMDFLLVSDSPYGADYQVRLDWSFFHCTKHD